MHFCYVLALFVAVGTVAAIPTGNVVKRTIALDGTTDEKGRMLRIFKLAAVKKNKAQMENDRLAPAPKEDEAAKDEAKDEAKDA